MMTLSRPTGNTPYRRLGAQDEQCSVPYIRAQIVSFGRIDTSQEIRRGPIIYSFEPYTGAVGKTVGF
jgi:hypothetical protein